MKSVRKWPSRRIFGWWYISIGVGFLLLAINRLILGERPWLILIRLVIAVGFGALGYFEIRRA